MYLYMIVVYVHVDIVCLHCKLYYGVYLVFNGFTNSTYPVDKYIYIFRIILHTLYCIQYRGTKKCFFPWIVFDHVISFEAEKFSPSKDKTLFIIAYIKIIFFPFHLAYGNICLYISTLTIICIISNSI